MIYDLSETEVNTIRNLIIDWERQDFPNVNPEASNYGVDKLKEIFC